jgi:hypothetical protein
MMPETLTYAKIHKSVAERFNRGRSPQATVPLMHSPARKAFDMSISKAANGRHVVRVERESVIEIPGGAGRILGQTYYYGLYFHDDEVAQAWAMETFERSPGSGSQKGLTINLYKDGSTTVMSFQGAKSDLGAKNRNGFEGSWEFVAGTGRFEGIGGGGSYEGESFEGIAYSNVSGNVGKR